MMRKPFQERRILSVKEITDKSYLDDVRSITVLRGDKYFTFYVDMEVEGPNGPGYIEEISITAIQEATGIIAKAVGYLTILYRFTRPGGERSPFSTISEHKRYSISEFTPLLTPRGEDRPL